jgi:uncharacterized damage-inducible protein DinB
VKRLDPPTIADERPMLQSWLDYHRATVYVKCDGLREEDAWRAPLPSSPRMSPAGLVNHLYWVERNWFERVLTGADLVMPWKIEHDLEFRQSGDETLADVLARYAEQCARSNELASAYDLDTVVVHPATEESISVRWIYCHMIEETARHNGHLDAMRELIDGTVGE